MALARQLALAGSLLALILVPRITNRFRLARDSRFAGHHVNRRKLGARGQSDIYDQA